MFAVQYAAYVYTEAERQLIDCFSVTSRGECVLLMRYSLIDVGTRRMTNLPHHRLFAVFMALHLTRSLAAIDHGDTLM